MRYRISVLGRSSLRDQEGLRIDSVLQQPRRFALLVYLALEARSGPVLRDTVLGVFWPDKPQDRARGSLNQAIHYLRRSLGSDAIRTQGDSLEVDRERVSCDASELLAASEEGRWAHAVELYQGELLPGYYDSGSSRDFEHWLENTRRKVRRDAARCAWALAEADEARGEATEAVVWARRACEWSGSEEAQVRRLIEMLDRLGDRGGVMEAYGVLCRALEELGTDPAPATRELLARLKEGWALEGQNGLRTGQAEVQVGQPKVQVGEGEGRVDRGSVPASDTEGQGGQTPPPQRDRMGLDPQVANVRGVKNTDSVWRWPHTLRKVASIVVTAGLTVSILSLWGLTRGPSVPVTHRTTVVIEPMISDEASAAEAEMLRGELMTHLQEMTGLRVVAEADPDEVARDRGFVVKGNLLGMAEEFRGSFRLVDGESGTALAGTQMVESTSQLPEGLDAMARSLAQFVRREVGEALEERRLREADAPRSAITAVGLGKQDMILGASLRGSGSDDAAVAAYQKADSMFAEATRLAPGWDLPWIGRAEAAYGLMWMERRKKGGSREVERELVGRGLGFADEAIARDHRQAESMEFRALLHQWLWLLSQPDASGQSAEILARAEEDARRATEMDPYRARAWNVLGAVLLHRGEWADAYWALGRAVAADTHLRNDTEILSRLFLAAWESGNTEGARGWCSLLGERTASGWPGVSCRMYLMADSDTPDLRQLDELRRRAQAWSYWPNVAAQFDALAAVLHARAGDTDSARALLAGLPEAGADSELPYLEAWALLELGEAQRARGRIAEYVAARPAALPSVLGSRRLKGLEGLEQRFEVFRPPRGATSGRRTSSKPVAVIHGLLGSLLS